VLGGVSAIVERTSGRSSQLGWKAFFLVGVVAGGLLFGGLSGTWGTQMFVTAVAVGFAGLRVLRLLRVRALLTGELVRWETVRPQRKHLLGGALFGVGWAVSDACPGPVAAQLGRGFAWALCTAAGLFVGVAAWYALQDRRARVADSLTLARR
jgi:uncharacterized membrane protein YedE/YeeE